MLQPTGGLGLIPLHPNIALHLRNTVVEISHFVQKMNLSPFTRAPQIYLCPEKVDKIVKATCALHNWLMKTSPLYYIPPGTIDSEDEFGNVRPGSWRLDAPSPYMNNLRIHQGSNNYSAFAERRRTKYMQYFLREGAVNWQNKIVGNE